MMLRPGKILRFRGARAAEECATAEGELRGRCKRLSARELMLTQPVEYKPSACLLPEFTTVLQQRRAPGTMEALARS